MNRQLETIDLKGNQYARVATRLKQFKEDHPKSKVETINEKQEDGTIEFTCYLWKDKKDYLEMLKEVKDVAVARGTADSTGHSSGKAVAEKKFEKLETIALGRALANIGYMASGEIASFEEMEEFLSYKKEQKEEAINQAIEEIEKAKTTPQLKKVYMKYATDEEGRPAVAMEDEVIEAKNKRKAELSVTVINKKTNAAQKPGEKNETNPS